MPAYPGDFLLSWRCGERTLAVMTHDSPPRAWVDVDLAAIRRNLETACRALPGTQMMPVVKAGAYGHGLEAVARALDMEGVTFFGVANTGEARRLSRAGVRTRPFILGPAFPEEREEIVLNGWCATISTMEEAQHYQSLAAMYGKTLPIHLCIDTGMGRAGFLPDEWAGLGDALEAMPNLLIDGVVSHFPSADEDPVFTEVQIREYADAVAMLGHKFRFRFCHISSSAGLLAYKVPGANLARPGLMLYGVSPVASPWSDALLPTLKLFSRVTLVRTLPAGHGVAYGRTFITDRPTKVATIGIGYADGWPRHLSNRGARVWIHGCSCPMLGRVTMDQIIADVTNVPFLVPGDEVELIGSHIPVTEVAERAGTIPWEILTSLGPRLPRVYHGA